ncbi:hypothetical protein AD006_30415 (plasmid) [Pseudonocardia sp. EC080610-09]|uniref:DUF6933 domain-containing protein n=1 Tax=unclassified Pseudonocardia TaxID=2619320 RepID=UPI0007059D64|nr:MULTISPECIES: hypothetical protein [unclassified Pseudonocardia]ALL79849.1 hypothetical protein AD006_30415 [Pseudonocardia sp. EC080610-09]ALL85772.1 hypothetical protein AD017_30835 [Pseudonocardia sp. EC080619-01]
MIVRATAKILSLAGLEPRSLAHVQPSPSDWYVNQIWLARRKCLLITHAGTLYSVFVPAVRASQIRPLGLLLVSTIRASLRAEALATDTLGELDPDAVTVTTTADRRVLGAMNDHALLVRHVLADRGIRAETMDSDDVDVVHHALHRTINSVTEYTPPIEMLTNPRS